MAETAVLSPQSPYKSTIQPLQEIDTQPVRKGGSGKLRQYATAIIVNVAALAVGTVCGWPSPAGPVLTSLDTPIEAAPVSDQHMNWLASINFITAIAGTLMYGVLADTLGRRMTGLAVAMPYLVSWVLIAATSDLWVLYLARVLAGIAVGGTMVVSPLYVSETADDENRGALGTFLAVGVNGGILFAFVAGAFASYRVFPLVCLSLPLIFIAGLIYLPETPVYLVKRGRMGRALSSLQWYRGGPSPQVDAELQALQVAAKRETDSGVTFHDLFVHRGTRHALIQNCFLLINQQFCGVMAVLSFTEEIFQRSGSSLNPVTASIIVAAMQALMTYLSSLLVPRLDRKTLLNMSNAVMAVSISILGGCFYAISVEHDISHIGWLPVASMSIYVIFFALGLGPIPLVLQGETYGAKVRSRATSIGMGVQSLAAFASIKLIGFLENRLGMHGALWFFAVCCVIGIAFTVLYATETRGKTMEQILRVYNGEPEDGVGEGGVDDRIPQGRSAQYVLVPTNPGDTPTKGQSERV